ncbi:MAG: hypothetical protein ACI4D4_07550 [Lachnospira sp.]
MKKRIIMIIGFIAIIVVILTVVIFNMRGNKSSEESLVFCSAAYDAGYGEYGSFSISITDGAVFSTSFKDLSKFELGGAFSGMKVEDVRYDEVDNVVVFTLSGDLQEGDCGTVEGKGIVQNKRVKVDIPIEIAQAASNDVINDNSPTNQIEITLQSACFKDNLSTDDFILSGAASDMKIESVISEASKGDDGETLLSQKAILTLSGYSTGSDYAYVKVLESATTYNKELDLVITTDFKGAYILNDHVDTYTLSDVVHIKADDITFNNNLSKEDFSLEGCLKDYATIKNVEYINNSLIELQLDFPYAYNNATHEIGYIILNADTNSLKQELTCSTIVVSPEIKSDIQINEKNITINLTMDHEEFNSITTDQFNLYYSNGNPVNITGTNIEKNDNNIIISFTIPEGCKGVLYYELRDAYDIFNSKGNTENIMIKSYLYV